MDSLVIEATSLSNFLAQADANFPFKTPLLVQALDTNSRVITDGPDSTLVKTLSFFSFSIGIPGILSLQLYIYILSCTGFPEWNNIL